MSPSESCKLEQLVNSLFETRNRFLHRACSDSPLACLRPKELQVLEIISAELNLTMGALAHRTSLAMSTLSGIIARLESLGLVERTHAENDKRIIQVHLNGDGRKACRSRGDAKKRLCDKILSQLSEEEQREFLRLLEIVVTNASADDSELLTGPSLPS